MCDEMRKKSTIVETKLQLDQLFSVILSPQSSSHKSLRNGGANSGNTIFSQQSKTNENIGQKKVFLTPGNGGGGTSNHMSPSSNFGTTLSDPRTNEMMNSAGLNKSPNHPNNSAS